MSTKKLLSISKTVIAKHSQSLPYTTLHIALQYDHRDPYQYVTVRLNSHSTIILISALQEIHNN